MTSPADPPAAEPPELKRIPQTVWRTLRLSWQASPGGFAVLLGLTVVSAAVPPVLVFISRRLVDLIAQAPVAVQSLLPWAVGMGGLTVVQRILASLQSNRQQVFSAAVARHAELLFLRKTAQSELARFDDPAWHDRVQRVSQDLNYRPWQLTSQSIGLFGSLVTLVGMMGLLLDLHPLLLLLAVVATAIPMPFQRKVNRSIWQYYFRSTTREREQWYYRYLLSDTRAAKDVRAFVLEQHMLGRHQELASDRHAEMRRLFASADRVYVLGGLLGGLALVGAFLFVAQRGATGALSAGDVTALVGALTSVTAQISGIFSSLGLIDQHAPFLANFFDFLTVQPAIQVPPRPAALPTPLRGGIEISDLVFRYPASERPAIDHLSLHIREGEMVALVGDNGAGKTSLLKLLLRFYDPQGGSVRVGGVDVRDLEPRALRDRFGVLFQDYTNFSLRVRDSVAAGRVSTPATDAALWAALEAAQADQIVRKLPAGLDNYVGRAFENGMDLSGGEWQRLALARLMFRDADVWILDEPTSSLDPEAEAAIFAQLKQQLHGRIGIVISHRFSTVRIADRIAVMQDGRITELGSHDQLMALNGRYAHLFELQASAYR